MLVFNGINLEEYFAEKYEQGFFMVNDVRGRGVLSDEVNTLTVPNRPGSYHLNKRTPNRELEVDFSLKGVSFFELRKRIDELNDLLSTDEPVPISFMDEPDVLYYGTKEKVEENLEKSKIHQATITFICPMPYKLGKMQTHAFERNWTTEITSRFMNKGSVETPALVEIDVETPATFLDVWFGKYPSERNYFRIGYPLTVEEKTVQERERVMWDEMSTTVGWTPVSQFDDMKGTGSFKVRDGYALYCEDYGQERGFHGAIAKKNIPVGPLQDFEMEAWVRLKSTNIGQMGRVEVLLLDEASNIVARINMNDLYWDAEMTKAYMRIGNAGTPNSVRKLVDTSGAHPNTFNQFYGRLRVARRGNQWSVYVARFRDGTEIDDASLVERWIDESGNPMTNRKVAQVMIAIMAWDINDPVSVMSIDDLKIWKVNKVPSNTKPYIFDKGDKVVIDTDRSLVTINGKDAVGIKDIFSDFPVVIRGDNRVDIMPGDVGKATISFRERYR
ncbi:distal tail protein Dit [Bacillus cytotoxicus]|uniref:distal tail protein Dit n=4 Tax=Bacillus cytotoxicus TaxID=580165 RepID=UPI000B35FDEB|nr:distal tail protein Dit [Bacillus cytotoxicus]AWC29070.1 phage tail protein [Bacillus cytotoxicus]AWC39544.1 phage tail protein [Bacillus cytotoxicus]AWC47475.1 phage tail protein [Bacillus cytotoxicus]AWC53141.1 phage tail protein [Bacillus cytotoxicus]AWC57270.1 phage tail protein [Bacillus cytotoxicus]